MLSLTHCVFRTLLVTPPPKTLLNSLGRRRLPRARCRLPRGTCLHWRCSSAWLLLQRRRSICTLVVGRWRRSSNYTRSSSSCPNHECHFTFCSLSTKRANVSMLKLFGLSTAGSASPSEAAAATEASTKQIRDALALLDKREAHLEKKCQDELRQAKARMAGNDKRGECPRVMPVHCCTASWSHLVCVCVRASSRRELSAAQKGLRG